MSVTGRVSVYYWKSSCLLLEELVFATGRVGVSYRES